MVGVTKEMKCGVKGTILWNSEDRKKVNIEFENGVIMKNRNYASFYNGCLNPSAHYVNMCEVGYIFNSKQGDVVKVINVINSRKILIEFQDEKKYKKYVTHGEIKKNMVFNP